MTGATLRSAAFTALVLVALAADARAGGTVLSLDGNDIYIDLGAKDGVGTGSKLTLMHVIVAKDPVSGKTLRDRFPLGTLTVIKAGDQVCVAQASQELRPRIRVGDEVTLASEPRTFEDPWVAELEARRAEREARARLPSTPEETAAARKAAREKAVAEARAAIAEAEAAKAAWQKTLGKAPAERIAIWQAFLQKRPESPYADEVRQEIDSLRAQIRAEEKLAEQMVDPQSRRAELRVRRLAVLEESLDLRGALAVRAPAEVYEGTPVELSFTVLKPGAVDRGWLYFRSAGDDSYQRVELIADGDAYMRGVIPAEVARPPGIDFFVEVSGDADSEPARAIASQVQPRRITVQAAVEEQPADIDDRSRVTLFMDYVDFDGGFGDGFDQYLLAEVDFMYRFYKPIYALRVGFGTLGGFGGPKDWIDQYPDDCRDDSGTYRCRRVSFSYAYTELEYRFTPAIAVMLRPQFGTGTSDGRPNTNPGRCNTGDLSECELFSAFGLRARIRIGDERGTNLTLGVGITENVGNVFEAAYTWSVIPRFPVMLAAHVTDQPVPEDYGVRLIADVGWRELSWVYPSLRVAYQARDVDHAGLSGGVAVNFDW